MRCHAIRQVSILYSSLSSLMPLSNDSRSGHVVSLPILFMQQPHAMLWKKKTIESSMNAFPTPDNLHCQSCEVFLPAPKFNCPKGAPKFVLGFFLNLMPPLSKSACAFSSLCSRDVCFVRGLNAAELIAFDERSDVEGSGMREAVGASGISSVGLI